MKSGSDSTPDLLPSPCRSAIAASVWSWALATTTRKLRLISFTALSVSRITSSTLSESISSFLRLASAALSQRSSMVSSPTTTCWKRRVRLRHLRKGSSPPDPIWSSSAFTSRTTSAMATSAATGTRASEIVIAQNGIRKDIHTHGRKSTTTSAKRRYGCRSANETYLMRLGPRLPRYAVQEVQLAAGEELLDVDQQDHAIALGSHAREERAVDRPAQAGSLLHVGGRKLNHVGDAVHDNADHARGELEDHDHGEGIVARIGHVELEPHVDHGDDHSPQVHHALQVRGRGGNRGHLLVAADLLDLQDVDRVLLLADHEDQHLPGRFARRGAPVHARTPP